ncbi:poly [ADP-ribose] polymerase [Elysia marginata]|uniref:Poly [ADP-ribose] polymerase n=1 Tax=Elysia marginata TaxID=1093978 RepID=A0AAV4I836_9GAST|nr:poly [ADP-ribose] polymerase [Elysia marginata]
MLDYKKDMTLNFVRLFLVLIIPLSCVSISLTFSWRAVFGLACLAGTYLFSYLPKVEKKSLSDNPYRGKKGKGYLSKDTEETINKLIADFVVYDANTVASLERFNEIKSKTECTFAKRSKLWGLIPTFYKFSLAFQDLGLDAFVIELPGHLYGSDIETFGAAVRQVLITLRQADVKRQTQQLQEKAATLDPVDVENRMRYLGPENSVIWDRRSWVFEFNKISFFITTFAPFYPETNSRFGFGAQHCYILFQPEISFAIHDLPPDTPVTNWDRPVSVRDKIRVAYREAGREYEAPMVARRPMVYDIVKPVDAYDVPLEWWKVSKSK